MTNNDRLNLSDLKAKTPADLLSMAEEWEIENAPSMRKGEMMFSILKEHAEEGWEIGGDGVLEVLQDGFGFLRFGEFAARGSVHQVIETIHGAFTEIRHQIHFALVTRFEAQCGGCRNQQMLTEGSGSVEFQGPVHFKKMEVRPDLHWSIAGIAHLQRGDWQLGVILDRLSAADITAHGHFGSGRINVRGKAGIR